MGILKQAREKAAGVAKDAADATARAASTAAARAAATAADPATRERVKGGLVQAGHAAGDVSRAAAETTTHAARSVAATAADPTTHERVRSGVRVAGSGVRAAGRGAGSGIRAAGRSARTMIERIDPGLLAEVVVKATALQERTNAKLRARGSVYRIGELQVTASLPPGISFAITRIDDDERHRDLLDEPRGRSSTELLAAEAEDAGITSLDLGEPDATIDDDADEGELGATEAAVTGWDQVGVSAQAGRGQPPE